MNLKPGQRVAVMTGTDGDIALEPGVVRLVDGKQALIHVEGGPVWVPLGNDRILTVPQLQPDTIAYWSDAWQQLEAVL